MKLKNESENNQLTLAYLLDQLKKHNFFVPVEHQASLWNWVQFFCQETEHLPQLINEIVAKGQCSACSKPEFVIYHEEQAGDEKNHLICAGCQKVCDGGEKHRTNDYYSFSGTKCGAYVFEKRSQRVEEWYCWQCKFELLCGDCGAPHELDTDIFVKPENENFALCEDCQINREEQGHEEHLREPNLDCWLCQQWIERWEEKQELAKKEQSHEK